MPTVTPVQQTRSPVALRLARPTDPRAAETTSELKKAVRRHMAAKARLHACTAGTAEYMRTRMQIDDLRCVIVELHQTLRERPWTEV